MVGGWTREKGVRERIKVGKKENNKTKDEEEEGRNKIKRKGLCGARGNSCRYTPMSRALVVSCCVTRSRVGTLALDPPSSIKI